MYACVYENVETSNIQNIENGLYDEAEDILHPEVKLVVYTFIAIHSHISIVTIISIVFKIIENYCYFCDMPPVVLN